MQSPALKKYSAAKTNNVEFEFRKLKATAILSSVTDGNECKKCKSDTEVEGGGDKANRISPDMNCKKFALRDRSMSCKGGSFFFGEKE